MKVAVATCRERVAYWEHTDSLRMAQAYLSKQGASSIYIADSPTYIHRGRERLMNGFLNQTDADFLCYVDSDNTLPPESLWNLTQNDADIVGATYFGRRAAPAVVAYRWVNEERALHAGISKEVMEFYRENNVQPQARAACVDIGAPHLWEVDVVGFGCAMIKRHVIEAMSEAYEEVFGGHGEKLGEDCIFCKRAQDLGFKVHLDLSVQLGHLVTRQITMAHFMAISDWEND